MAVSILCPSTALPLAGTPLKVFIHNIYIYIDHRDCIYVLMYRGVYVASVNCVASSTHTTNSLYIYTYYIYTRACMHELA